MSELQCGAEKFLEIMEEVTYVQKDGKVAFGQTKPGELHMSKDLKKCAECGKTAYTEVHHMINGRGLRKLCDEDGLVVDLCPACHRAVHASGLREEYWKQEGQRRYESTIGTRDEFLKRYSKNYLWRE